MPSASSANTRTDRARSLPDGPTSPPARAEDGRDIPAGRMECGDEAEDETCGDGKRGRQMRARVHRPPHPACAGAQASRLPSGHARRSTAITVPSTAPPTAMSMLSASDWPRSCRRPAPSAVRTATSVRAGCSADEQQVGHIRAGDQQHEHHGPQHSPERPLDVAHDRLPERDGGHADPGMQSLGNS